VPVNSEQEGAEQGSAEQEGAEQEGAEQGSAEQEGAEQEGAEQEGAEQQGAEQEGAVASWVWMDEESTVGREQWVEFMGATKPHGAIDMVHTIPRQSSLHNGEWSVQLNTTVAPPERYSRVLKLGPYTWITPSLPVPAPTDWRWSCRSRMIES
jgi:hypothetical protein